RGRRAALVRLSGQRARSAPSRLPPACRAARARDRLHRRDGPVVLRPAAPRHLPPRRGLGEPAVARRPQRDVPRRAAASARRRRRAFRDDLPDRGGRPLTTRDRTGARGKVDDVSRAVVVVQARVSSRRLPGKVLADLVGAPLLARLLERLALVRGTSVAVATSTDRTDDPIAALV